MPLRCVSAYRNDRNISSHFHPVSLSYPEELLFLHLYNNSALWMICIRLPAHNHTYWLTLRILYICPFWQYLSFASAGEPVSYGFAQELSARFFEDQKISDGSSSESLSMHSKFPAFLKQIQMSDCDIPVRTAWVEEQHILPAHHLYK